MGMAEVQRQITKRILKEIKEKDKKIYVVDPLEEYNRYMEKELRTK